MVKEISNALRKYSRPSIFALSLVTRLILMLEMTPKIEILQIFGQHRRTKQFGKAGKYGKS